MEIRLNSVINPVTNTHQWALEAADGDVVLLTVPVNRDDIVATMIEMATIYPEATLVAPPSNRDFSLNWEQAGYGSVILDYSLAHKNQVVATIKNGDTGVEASGTGSSIINAAAALLTATGFKTTLDKDQTLTSAAWLRDFKYGMNRLSDERLQAEMEVIRAPDAGAW